MPSLTCLWPLGPLWGAANAVGVANIFGLSLVYPWLMHFIVEEVNQVLIAGVICTLYSFFLLLVNVALLYAAKMAQKGHNEVTVNQDEEVDVEGRKSSYVLPWLIAYLVSIVGLIICCSIYFHRMDRFQVVAIMAVIGFVYFYSLIAAFFNQLLMKEKRNNLGSQEEGTELKQGQGQVEDSKLITIINEEEDEDQDEGDETFTDLASRKDPTSSVRAEMRNGNPFGTPLKGDPTSFSAEFHRDLPKPDEVIEIGEENEPLIDGTDGTGPPALLNAAGKSLTKLNPFLDPVQEETTAGQGQGHVPTAKKSLSHSALLDIDSSFTPFKKKCKSTLESELPKMRVFLPKDQDDDDDDDDSSSSSSVSHADHH